MKQQLSTPPTALCTAWFRPGKLSRLITPFLSSPKVNALADDTLTALLPYPPSHPDHQHSEKRRVLAFLPDEVTGWTVALLPAEAHGGLISLQHVARLNLSCP